MSYQITSFVVVFSKSNDVGYLNISLCGTCTCALCYYQTTMHYDTIVSQIASWWLMVGNERAEIENNCDKNVNTVYQVAIQYEWKLYNLP